MRPTVLWCKKNRRNRLWGKCPYPDGSPIAGERVTSPTKKRLSDVYESAADERTAGLLKSMILGDKSSLDAEIKELYQENGIAHVLAISGLHVSLLGLGLYRLLRRGTGHFLLAGIPTIVLLLAYGYLTGTSVSTVRAVVMCVLFILAEILGRTYDMLTGLALSGLLITVLMPLQLRQSAF